MGSAFRDVSGTSGVWLVTWGGRGGGAGAFGAAGVEVKLFEFQYMFV